MSVARTADQSARPGLFARRAVMPPGLYRLILFQFWDNLAFYGSRLLLVLYLIDVLAHPEIAAGIWGLTAAHGWAADRLAMRSDQAFVSAIFGLFGALAFVTPVIGGWLSDRYMTRRDAVIAGSLLMAAGHAMLALRTPFLFGLVLLALGNGFYRSTVSAMLAGLFPRDDPRLASGFQLGSLASNLALIVTPLVCGTLGELVGWSWGFGAAALAMVLGLATFLSIPKAALTASRSTAPDTADEASDALLPRLVLIGGVALFAIGNEQLGNAMVVWLKGSVDRSLGPMTLPLTWFFTISPLTIAAAALVLARRRAGAGPDAVRRRMVSGCLIGAGGWAMLALAAVADHVAAIWPILFLLLWGGAFALVLPSGAGLMAVLTPEAARGRWLGLYYLVTMIASLAVGWLGGLYGRMPHPVFIALHGAIVLAGAAVLAGLPLRRRDAQSP